MAPEKQLFVTMYWLRTYPPFWNISFIFGLGIRYVPKILKRCLHALQHLSKTHEPIRMPTAEEFAELQRRQKPWQVPGTEIDFALDGLHLEVRNVSKKNCFDEIEAEQRNEMIRNLRNAKHKCAATNVLCICDLSGIPVWYDGPAAGHEAAQLRDCDLREELHKLGARCGRRRPRRQHSQPGRPSCVLFLDRRADHGPPLQADHQESGQVFKACRCVLRVYLLDLAGHQQPANDC